MTLRRKTRRKATFELQSQYKTRTVLYIIDCKDFFILREFKDHGRGFSRTGDAQWIGKSLVETLHGLNYQLMEVKTQ